MPQTLSITSVRPAPTRPVKPRISPAWTVKEASLKKPVRLRPSTFSISLPIFTSGLGNRSLISRPTMALMSSALVISSTL